MLRYAEQRDWLKYRVNKLIIIEFKSLASLLSCGCFGRAGLYSTTTLKQHSNMFITSSPDESFCTIEEIFDSIWIEMGQRNKFSALSPSLPPLTPFPLSLLLLGTATYSQ